MQYKHIDFKPIGFVKSPIDSPKNSPIQPSGAAEIEGEIVLDELYTDGLRDLSGFSHIIVLYHFHLIDDYKLLCKPFLDDCVHGIFAIRGPARPNPIGLSVVELKKIVDNRLYIKGVDMVDGTPVLDIKPYVPQFDFSKNVRIGWLEGKAEKSATARSDDRFVDE